MSAAPWSRREFVAALVAAPALVGLSNKSGPVIGGGYIDDHSAAGHALRDATPYAPARTQRRAAVAIVGGGVGGLSAAWRLDARGMHDWVLLELSDVVGGNARSGRNNAGSFPWGAHYLPVPDQHAEHVRALMRELGVLDASGQWDERMLCHSPQERLFQHGRWHEGLEPMDALAGPARAEFARFDAQVAAWRASGVFTVPSALGQRRLAESASALNEAQRRQLRALDTQTADAWLRANDYRTPELRWWIEYGLRDDYGCSLQTASAWAVAHYFASRAHDDSGPLTWPEGNDWIVQRLTARLEHTRAARVVTNAPVRRIERRGGSPSAGWLVRTPQVDVLCDAIVWAAPLFVLPKVLPQAQPPVTFEHASWVVANLTLRRPPVEQGAPSAWDNVIYDSPSLGYVDAGHQSLATRDPRRVWTWYHAVVDRPAADGRRWLQQRPWSAWRDQIVADLSRAHADVADCIERIDIMRWGHAMARPLPGVLSRTAQVQRWSPAPRVFLAHADLSSLSLFEEAQWHGVQAADRVVQALGGNR